MRSQRHSRKRKVVAKKQSTGKDGPYHEMLLQFKKEESVGGVVFVFVFSAGGARRPASAQQLIGGRDRPINPARRQERDGEDNAGQRRWAGALERSRLSGVRWQQRQAGGAPVQSKSESAITGFSVFSKEWLLAIRLFLSISFYK